MATVKWAGGVENGAIPAPMLDSVGTYQGDQMLLNPAAAAAFEQWAAEWESQEHGELIVDEANRTLARQQYLYNGYIKGLPGFYVAAVPGTSSHGEALAVDILSSCYSKDINQHQRLVDMGLKYGWSWYTVGKPSGESWHFNYIRDPLAGGNATPINVKDWFDMASLDDLKTAVATTMVPDKDGNPQWLSAILNRLVIDSYAVQNSHQMTDSTDGSQQWLSAVVKEIQAQSRATNEKLDQLIALLSAKA